VTLIQRFRSALNLHFHMLFLDGVYFAGANGKVAWFRWARAPQPVRIPPHTNFSASGSLLV
jgi:hypothetical protein